MRFTEEDVVLVTGATGFVGSHIAQRARELQIRTRALARESSDTKLLADWGVDVISGDMTNPEALGRAVDGVTVIIHCAAKVGDWGPVADYRRVNVEGLEHLLAAAESNGTLKRFVHMSSLGVYEARDHYGTDESEAPNVSGIDGYTRTKVESEDVVRKHIQQKHLPAIVLRPGFVYGPRDRIVLPRILSKLKAKVIKFFGSGDQLMNNIFVGNLADATFAAIDHDNAVGQIYNLTDGKLVSKREFVSTIANLAGYPVPTKSVPLPVAKVLARALEGTWRLLKKKNAPLVSSATIKFMGLNLDFCIDKARRELDYDPQVEFADGIKQAIDWCRENGLV